MVLELLRRQLAHQPEPQGVAVIDDFAHHPTAVKASIGALRARFSDRRLVVFFEARTNTSRRSIFQDAYARAFDGASRVLIRGSDSPAVDGGKIRSALTALSESDLVVLPDLDGGYNLVGLRVPAPGLFDHPMSTRTVLEDTLANARAAGLRCDLQEPAFDIDTAEDLVHLARARSGPNRAEITKLCFRTLAYLDERALWPDPRWA